MAQEKVRTTGERWKELLGEDREFFKSVVQEVFQQVLETEMDDVLQAQKGERTPGRLRVSIRDSGAGTRRCTPRTAAATTRGI